MLKRFLLPIFFASSLFANAVYSQISSDPPFLGDTAGIVNGRVLARKAYITTFADITWQAPGQKHPLSQQEIVDAHRKTWDALVVDAIIEDGIEEKGITVTDSEVLSVLVNDPPEFLKNNFKDSSGVFHRQEYLQTLHDPRNDSIVQAVINTMKPTMRKEKFYKVLVAPVTVMITDDQLWDEFKKQKGASRKEFNSKKEELRQEKQMSFLYAWIEASKGNAKIIDYRTIK